MTTPILNVKNLTVKFAAELRIITAVEAVSFPVLPGEVLGIVGESGSGKPTTSLAIMRLLSRTAQISGSILFQPDGSPAIDLLTLSAKAMESIRGGKIAMIFQDPLSSLNPVYICGAQVVEAIRLHESVSYKDAYRRALVLLDEVQLPDPKGMMKRYPYELLGGNCSG